MKASKRFAVAGKGGRGHMASAHAVSSMARRRSSIGLFGIFGRSYDLRQLDQALRSVDVHPMVVPEAVKLTAVNLLKDRAVNDDPAPQSYRAPPRSWATA